MKTILITAYAIHPLKGSEDAMGWNYVRQASRHQRVIAVTRKNNRPGIEAYFASPQADPLMAERVQFLYFDWPQWMLFWKKGPLLSMIYFYAWQLCIALWLKRQELQFDIAHNLNFHNDWTPSFLWLLGKPFVWGPVGHHPPIPRAFALQDGSGAYLKDRALWLLKLAFWHLDPFLAICKRKSAYTWCMHPDSARRLRLRRNFWVYPSIAAEPVDRTPVVKEDFTILSVGRFVSLKGFDITIRSFARFYRELDPVEQSWTRLVLVGKGPQKDRLEALTAELGLEDKVRFVDWMPRQELHTLYRQASVFLYPSHEGAGMVVAEAMRYGLPVVCWDNDGPGELVHPESTLKVSCGAGSAAIGRFAAHLHELYTDPFHYGRESSLALSRFDHDLNWETRAGKLQVFYQSALHTTPALKSPIRFSPQI